jgi:hypothetical protein
MGGGGKVDYPLICPYAGVPLYTHYTQYLIYIYMWSCVLYGYTLGFPLMKKEKKKEKISHMR